MIGERPSVDLDLVEVRCSVCGRTTTADEVLAVYDRRAPWRRRFVCRPTLPGGQTFTPCFRSVAPGEGIAPASEPCR